MLVSFMMAKKLHHLSNNVKCFRKFCVCLKLLHRYLPFMIDHRISCHLSNEEFGLLVQTSVMFHQQIFMNLCVLIYSLRFCIKGSLLIIVIISDIKVFVLAYVP